MKYSLLLCLFFCITQKYPLNNGFENDLERATEELKRKIFYEWERKHVASDLNSLLWRIEKAIENPEGGDSLKELMAIKDDVSALLTFVNSINGSKDGLTKSQFLRSLELLGVRAVKITDEECSFAAFYELTIDRFKAMFICNEIPSKESLNSSITVTYSVKVRYDTFVDISGGNKVIFCCNKVLCLYTKSDSKFGIYPEKILNVVCTKNSILIK